MSTSKVHSTNKYSGLTISHFNGDKYRIRADGKLDRRYKTSKNMTPTREAATTSSLKHRADKITRSKVTRSNLRQFSYKFLFFIYVVLGLTLFVWRKTEDIIDIMPSYDLLDILGQFTVNFKPTIPELKVWDFNSSGIASYYSRTGCIGCSANLTMANGEVLDDSRLTLAHNQIPLNTDVRVCHDNKCVTATVTDTGGFNELGRIADLSLATKEAINCTDLCEVSIYK